MVGCWLLVVSCWLLVVCCLLFLLFSSCVIFVMLLVMLVSDLMPFCHCVGHVCFS